MTNLAVVPFGWVAETEGNRTLQAQILDLTGFEGRGQHQPTARLHRRPYWRNSLRSTLDRSYATLRRTVVR